MKYTNIRTRVNNSSIQKFGIGGIFDETDLTDFLDQGAPNPMPYTNLHKNKDLVAKLKKDLQDSNDLKEAGGLSGANYDEVAQNLLGNLQHNDSGFGELSEKDQKKITRAVLGRKSNLVVKDGLKELPSLLSGVNFSENAKWRNSGLSDKAATGMGMGAQVATKAFAVADELAMGDKNFDAQSQAIDSAVHGVSGALLKSGNPYAMAAGAALEGANFITKAGGQTVQGFDVDINSSGYGELGHMESASQRDFGAAIGLGGLNMAKTERLLRDRNEQAQMALKAAGIASEQKFESEARMNSVENVMSNNNIALNGGISTDLIGG